MLNELRENNKARYPVNTAHRSGKTDGYDWNAGHPDWRKGGYIAHVANVEPYPDTPLDVSPGQLPFGKDLEEAYEEGYYIGVVNTADEMSQCLRLCYNCGLARHYWADCTEPLSDSLKLAKERLNRGIQEKQENQLNPNEGTGGKGARTSQPMPAKANPAKAQNWTVPDPLPLCIGMRTLKCVGSTRLTSEQQSSMDS